MKILAKRAVRLAAAAVLATALPAATQAAEKLKGYVEYRKGEFLIVDGQRVAADRKTKVEGSSRQARRFETIPVGYEVEVKGRRRGDGAILARSIEASRNRDTGVEESLKKGFDEIEALYRKEGRMVNMDEQGKVVQDYGALLQSGPLVDRTRRIADSLLPPYLTPADVRVYVVENQEWNAMAAPNYSIYVFSGLLKDMDDDEVAIVVGHEIAHATHEHSRQQYQRNTWIALGAALTAEIAGGAIEDESLGQMAQMGTLLSASAVINGYSRDHEDQADRVGLRYAFEAGYDVRKGPRLWKRFADKYGDSNVAVNFFFGGHSRSSKRARLLEEEIAFHYSGREKPLAARSR